MIYYNKGDRKNWVNGQAWCELERFSQKYHLRMSSPITEWIVISWENSWWHCVQWRTQDLRLASIGTVQRWEKSFGSVEAYVYKLGVLNHTTENLCWLNYTKLNALVNGFSLSCGYSCFWQECFYKVWKVSTVMCPASGVFGHLFDPGALKGDSF